MSSWQWTPSLALCSQSTDSEVAVPLPTDADGIPYSGQLLEDPPQRLRWQAHLEFTHNHDVGDLTWDKIAVSLPRSEKLRSLVLAGVPHSMRPQVRRGPTEAMGTGAPRGLSAVPPPQLWMRLSGALQKKRNSELSYREIVKNSSNDETIAAKQVRPCGGGQRVGGGPSGLAQESSAARRQPWVVLSPRYLCLEPASPVVALGVGGIVRKVTIPGAY